MKNNVNYYNAEERNGLILLLFLLLLFCSFIFLQKRVLSNETHFEIRYASVGSITDNENEQEKSLVEDYKLSPKHFERELETKSSRVEILNERNIILEKINFSEKKHEPLVFGKVKNAASWKKNLNFNTIKKSKIRKGSKKVESNTPTFSINSQDPLEWEQLYGIGPAYSARIIKYQKWLGGFHDVNQLKEVYGLTDSLVESFRDKLIITEPYRKIQINSVQEKELGKHPYLSWKQAKLIIRYRKHHGTIDYKKWQQLKGIPKETKTKLIPYIVFENYPKNESKFKPSTSDLIQQKDTTLKVKTPQKIIKI